MKKFILALVLILGFFIIASTKKHEPSLTSQIKTGEVATSENKALKDPVIGDEQFFKGAKWGDPSVIFHDGKYIMYASAGKDISGDDIDIYRLESTDGVAWKLNPEQPVLQNSTSAEAVDRKSVETPSVVFFNGMYHMFYTGYATSFSNWKEYRIMHATSEDGVTWTKEATPVLTPTDPNNTTPNLDFNQWIEAEPGAVVFKNKIYLYFAASGANMETQSDLFTIGLTTSSDGKTWSKPKMVLMPDQTIYPRKTYQGYSTPGAAVHNGKVELFFGVAAANPFHQIAIARAVSSDGETNWVLDKNPLLTRDDFTWTSAQIVSPSPLYVDGKLYMWFSGNTKSALGIGLYREK
jgi:predicted GH43/DUF377 family glycosyl hydrolase